MSLLVLSARRQSSDWRFGSRDLVLEYKHSELYDTMRRQRDDQTHLLLDSVLKRSCLAEVLSAREESPSKTTVGASKDRIAFSSPAE
jgi:hypothetical protein